MNDAFDYDVIVRKAQCNDESALQEILDAFQAVVHLRVKNHCTNEADYDDLFQEGMMGLLSAIRSFSSNRGVKFRTYAGICIDHRIITAVKVLYKQHKNMLHSTSSAESGTFSPSYQERVASPEEIFINSESIGDLYQLIQTRLSLLEKRILKLYLAGYSYMEIAAIMEKDVKVIDNALYRLKRKLSINIF